MKSYFIKCKIILCHKKKGFSFAEALLHLCSLHTTSALLFEEIKIEKIRLRCHAFIFNDNLTGAKVHRF
jgi:hypothetical protein